MLSLTKNICHQPPLSPVILPQLVRNHSVLHPPLHPFPSPSDPHEISNFGGISSWDIPIMGTQETPKNFWGDPEEEYYASQGVINTKSYFDTPHAKIFTQSFLPLEGNVKGSFYMSHGYGSDTGWLFQKICINYATWGYAVFTADLLGHGDMKKVVATSLHFFPHVRKSEPYKDMPAFLFGESMGGAATMLMYFQSEPDTWTGLIFSAPLFVIPEPMKPSKVRLFAYSLLFGMADTWASMPDNKMVGRGQDAEALREEPEEEPEEDAKRVLGDMREWIDARAERYCNKK